MIRFWLKKHLKCKQQWHYKNVWCAVYEINVIAYSEIISSDDGHDICTMLLGLPDAPDRDGFKWWFGYRHILEIELPYDLESILAKRNTKFFQRIWIQMFIANAFDISLQYSALSRLILQSIISMRKAHFLFQSSTCKHNLLNQIRKWKWTLWFSWCRHHDWRLWWKSIVASLQIKQILARDPMMAMCDPRTR